MRPDILHAMNTATLPHHPVPVNPMNTPTPPETDPEWMTDSELIFALKVQPLPKGKALEALTCRAADRLEELTKPAEPEIREGMLVTHRAEGFEGVGMVWRIDRQPDGRPRADVRHAGGIYFARPNMLAPFTDPFPADSASPEDAFSPVDEAEAKEVIAAVNGYVEKPEHWELTPELRWSTGYEPVPGQDSIMQRRKVLQQKSRNAVTGEERWADVPTENGGEG